jgi:hypothetical protein
MNGFFGSDTLDVAIGLTLFFLLVSLICSAAREGWEAILKTRAKDLERGLREMLADPKGDGLMKTIFQHPLLDSLFPKAYDPERLHGKAPRWTGLWVIQKLGLAHRNLPSYVPADHFAKALLDIVARGPVDETAPAAATDLGGPALTVEAIREAAAAFPDQRIGRIVLTALDTAAGDVANAQAAIASWFDNSMDRVSGWYKRRTQRMLFLLGLGAAVVLNLDALSVLQHLSQDKALRQNAVAAAERRVEASKGAAATESADALRKDLDTVGFPTGWTAGRPVPQPSYCDVATTVQHQGIGGLKLWPVGSEDPASFDCNGNKVTSWAHYWAAPRDRHGGGAYVLTWGHILMMLVGWLMTALAVMLGAPFWFDLLSKFMNIRSAIKPDAAPAPQPQKTAPPPAQTPPAETADATPPAPEAPAQEPPPTNGGDGNNDGDDPPFTPNTWADRPDAYEGAL